MKEKVKIITSCSHFDDIINYDFLEDDILTKKIIQYYQDYIFSIEEANGNLEDVRKLDDALYKYIDDYRFAKSLKETLDVDMITSESFNYLDKLMEYIIDFFSSYDESSIPVAPTKWL